MVDLDRLWKAKRDAGYSPTVSGSCGRCCAVLSGRLSVRELRPGTWPGCLPRRASGPKDGRTLTVDQARQLLEAAPGYRFEAAAVLALAYGMRRSEVLGLHWSSLDWKAGTLGSDARCEARQGP